MSKYVNKKVKKLLEFIQKDRHAIFQFAYLGNDGTTIYLNNECPYAHGGGEDYVLFAENRESLEEIAKDLSITDYTITPNYVAQQTL